MAKDATHCSFCGRSADQVEKLISSPDGKTGICDECIDVCCDMLDKEEDEAEEVYYEGEEEEPSFAKSKKPNLHTATRVFQGLRIAVNDELNRLELGLKAAFECLNSDGLLAVITFHSLEDRIVKRHFYDWCGRSLTRDDAQPRQLKTVRATLMTRKPITATEAEISSNPRARSAKLRILKKS